MDYESHAVALDRNELGALLVAAGFGPPTEHALISLLALNGASGIRGDRGRYRAPGPRTQAPDPDHHPERRQGGDCPAGTAHGPGDRPGRRRAHRLAGVPGRGRATAGPARRRQGRPQGRPPSGHRQDRDAPHAQARVHHRVKGTGSRCATCKKPPRTPTRAPRCGQSRPAAASTGTQPTWPPPTSQAPPGNGHRLEQLCQAVTAAGQSSRCRRSDRSPSVTHRDPTADAIRLTHVGRIPTRALAFRTGHSALARDGR